MSLRHWFASTRQRSPTPADLRCAPAAGFPSARRGSRRCNRRCPLLIADIGRAGGPDLPRARGAKSSMAPYPDSAGRCNVATPALQGPPSNHADALSGGQHHSVAGWPEDHAAAAPRRLRWIPMLPGTTVPSRIAQPIRGCSRETAPNIVAVAGQSPGIVAGGFVGHWATRR